MRTDLLSRRQFVVGGLAAGASAWLGACSGGRAASTASTASTATASTLRRAVGVRPAGSDLGAIEHVVFLMQENRSFDHYFGTYRGVRGFDDHPGGGPGMFAQPWPGGPSPALLPFHLDTVTGNGECVHDITHEWGPQHQCWNGGRMDGFASTHTATGNEGPTQGILTMGYYRRTDLPFYYTLADAFTICDSYHCSVLGPTDPNRLYSLSATIDLAGTAGGPVIGNPTSPAQQFSLGWTTMPEHLQAKGITWKVYNPTGTQYQPGNPIAQLLSNNILLLCRAYSDKNSALYQNAFVSLVDPDFASDVARGSLPQVSWIMSQTTPTDEDEHPPGPPTRGEWLTHKVLSTLVANPAVWAKTVLFICHDENGGFFDHVPPPTAPPGTAEEYFSGSSKAGETAGPVGLGFRVPMLVVSPFSRGGYVCSDRFDHTSQLRFLETRFGVEVPNLTAWRRNITGDLTSALNLAGPPDFGIPSLPIPNFDDPRITRGCTVNQLNDINDAKAPAYPTPTAQQLPVQEAGQARRHP